MEDYVRKLSLEALKKQEGQVTLSSAKALTTDLKTLRPYVVQSELENAFLASEQWLARIVRVSRMLDADAVSDGVVSRWCMLWNQRQTLRGEDHGNLDPKYIHHASLHALPKEALVCLERFLTASLVGP